MVARYAKLLIRARWKPDRGVLTPEKVRPVEIPERGDRKNRYSTKRTPKTLCFIRDNLQRAFARFRHMEVKLPLIS
jgi:hypothetical protein